MAPRAGAQDSLVNFAHLLHLTERVVLNGDSVSIVHVYANYPAYGWVDAKESGPEGIACVDDAARAAVAWLRRFEFTGNGQSLQEAKGLLSFVLAMQTADGDFYNFIRSDLSINRDGTTSRKSFGWWAARGVWAMSLGYRVFRPVDAAFASRLRLGVERSLPRAMELLNSYGRVDTVHGFRIPRWLLYDSAADATGELALGLLEWHAASPGARIQRLIDRLARGMMIMQDGNARIFPYGLHRSWETTWHMWGNSQTHVLAEAGKRFGIREFTRSAESEAACWYSRLLMQGFLKEMDVTAPASQRAFEQIAYGVRPMTLGLLRVYESTRKREYLIMAGLASSWLFGNNPPGVPIYDPHTGRCFDGVRDSTSVNRNSGAESTIESLLTLMELERLPDALPYSRYRRIRQGSKGEILFALFRNDAGKELALVLDTATSTVKAMEGAACDRFRESLP
jgi:hypothetical protein